LADATVDAAGTALALFADEVDELALPLVEHASIAVMAATESGATYRFDET
jgi:hypothetical protein